MASFVALGQQYRVTFHPLQQLAAAAPTRGRRVGAAAPATAVDPASMARTVAASPVLKTRIDDPTALAVVQASAASARRGRAAAAPVAPAVPTGIMLATQTVIGEGLRQADLAAAKSYGAQLLDEGLDGKVLLKVDTVERAFGLVELLQAREVGSVSPNFLRKIVRLTPSTPAIKPWALDKIGVPAAWAVTKGSANIRVAVLDEGVDTQHPALKSAVVAQRDFIGGNTTAMPDNNDAHGTACAGIVLSRDSKFQGVAPRCSLIAVRIAMGDGADGWVFDDFATADAIDWSWRRGADVLSNSWGGGSPSDAISRAFGRARTQGRQGRGAVVVIAAGNAQRPIDFPGNLPGYVTVGASTPKDERKTRTSSDGENWWGSNFGPTMRVLAPGVFIWTTDISGTAGYDPTNFTKTFNGTSSATPHVAGAAALMLSVAPHLSASTVRDLLGRSAKKLAGQTGWTPQLGFGRLDVAKAVAMAKAATPAGAKTTTKKKTTKKKAKKKK